MRTKKQAELIDGFLANLDPELGRVYRELILHLSGLGYDPKKQRSAIVFNCAQHNKQIAKIGFDRKGNPFFALRFSACRGYSQRFSHIVREAVCGKNYMEPNCMAKGEDFCKGPIDQRLYTYGLPNGETRYHCGAKALAIPGLSREDVPEIKRLMEEEHRFLMKYEAGPDPEGT
ncbi:hypothetical protein D7X94_06165 [Acutalibacter sp. 1XD8-33]|uniref:hypothetical protein n=1 Tax=Acutalibacter sp. 1XD8-33 TaxID=2320081 RepID=UPI000EA38BA1|nr:hypothetical protein [Acutalibacter sp. 1XD8-33]RKJ40984.1 hypothetical protein D7X94_06165 [Acutalibacter sp. 1XD8-33]